MIEKLNQLIDYADQVGLKINVIKSKLMRLYPISNQRTGLLQINNVNIKEVEEFCYMGSIISKNSVADSDIKSRIEKAHHAFGCLLKSSNIEAPQIEIV